MSNTNGTSRFAAREDHRALADSELDAVSGGDLPLNLISTMLKDLHDIRSSIINNLKG